MLIRRGVHGEKTVFKDDPAGKNSVQSYRYLPDFKQVFAGREFVQLVIIYLFKISKLRSKHRSFQGCSDVIFLPLNRLFPTGIVTVVLTIFSDFEHVLPMR